MLKSLPSLSALALLSTFSPLTMAEEPVDIQIMIPQTDFMDYDMAFIMADALAFPDNQACEYRWDTNRDGKYDDQTGNFVHFEYHLNNVSSYTDLINALNNKTALTPISVQVLANGEVVGTQSQIPFRLCVDRPQYYKERYDSCMATDSRGRNYCLGWMGCYGSIGPFNVDNGTGIFFP